MKDTYLRKKDHRFQKREGRSTQVSREESRRHRSHSRTDERRERRRSRSSERKAESRRKEEGRIPKNSSSRHDRHRSDKRRSPSPNHKRASEEDSSRRKEKSKREKQHVSDKSSSGDNREKRSCLETESRSSEKDRRKSDKKDANEGKVSLSTSCHGRKRGRSSSPNHANKEKRNRVDENSAERNTKEKNEEVQQSANQLFPATHGKDAGQNPFSQEQIELMVRLLTSFSSSVHQGGHNACLSNVTEFDKDPNERKSSTEESDQLCLLLQQLLPQNAIEDANSGQKTAPLDHNLRENDEAHLEEQHPSNDRTVSNLQNTNLGEKTPTPETESCDTSVTPSEETNSEMKMAHLERNEKDGEEIILPDPQKPKKNPSTSDSEKKEDFENQERKTNEKCNRSLSSSTTIGESSCPENVSSEADKNENKTEVPPPASITTSETDDHMENKNYSTQSSPISEVSTENEDAAHENAGGSSSFAKGEETAVNYEFEDVRFKKLSDETLCEEDSKVFQDGATQTSPKLSQRSELNLQERGHEPAEENQTEARNDARREIVEANGFCNHILVRNILEKCMELQLREDANAKWWTTKNRQMEELKSELAEEKKKTEQMLNRQGRFK